MKNIVNITPNENWQLIIQFSDDEYRLLDVAIPREEHNWKELAYPQHIKRFTFTPNEIIWEFGGELNASYLYKQSEVVDYSSLENQSLRLCYKNQAPTQEDKWHHVYGVYLHPFSHKLFSVGESIGGGHGDRGGSNSYSLTELLSWGEWKNHFNLSGCSWAIPIIESNQDKELIIRELSKEACRRNGV